MATVPTATAELAGPGGNDAFISGEIKEIALRKKPHKEHALPQLSTACAGVCVDIDENDSEGDAGLSPADVGGRTLA